MRPAPWIAVALALSATACSSSSGQSPAAAVDGAAEETGSDDGGTTVSEAAAPATEGGATGGDGGASGPEGGGSTPWPGTIGSGSVACYNNFDAGCPPHQACCNNNDPSNITCVTSYDDCTACANGNCPIQGCDGPEDCPGQSCCALVATSQSLLLTGCKASCDALSGEYVVCKTSSDCPGQARCHDIFGDGYMLNECD